MNQSFAHIANINSIQQKYSCTYYSSSKNIPLHLFMIENNSDSNLMDSFKISNHPQSTSSISPISPENKKSNHPISHVKKHPYHKPMSTFFIPNLSYYHHKKKFQQWYSKHHVYLNHIFYLFVQIYHSHNLYFYQDYSLIYKQFVLSIYSKKFT